MKRTPGSFLAKLNLKKNLIAIIILILMIVIALYNSFTSDVAFDLIKVIKDFLAIKAIDEVISP